MKGNNIMRLRTAFCIGSCGLAIAAVPAMAQDAAQDEPSSAEIIVTGSRVRGEAPVGSTVTTLGRKEIEASSAVTSIAWSRRYRRYSIWVFRRIRAASPAAVATSLTATRSTCAASAHMRRW